MPEAASKPKTRQRGFSMKVNDFIKTVLGCGMVLDIYAISVMGDRIVKVLWVRNVFKNQKAELIPMSMLESAVVCTFADVEDEITRTQMRIRKELDQFTEAQ